jgi:hypothetical protein
MKYVAPWQERHVEENPQNGRARKAEGTARGSTA